MTLLVPFLISPESDIEDAYKIQETFYNNFPDIDITFENRYCSQTILLNKLIDILNEYNKNENLLCYVVMDNIKIWIFNKNSKFEYNKISNFQWYEWYIYFIIIGKGSLIKKHNLYLFNWWIL